MEGMLATKKSARALDTLALLLVLLAVFMAPLPIGSETPWARATMFILVAAAAVAWVLGGVLEGTLHVVRSAALLFIAAFFLIGMLQVVPIPRDVLGFVSPNAGALREEAVGAGNAPAAEPLSLNPYATKTALMRYATCAMVFILLASLIRTRRAVTVAVAVLIAAGLFQVVYSVFERLSESGGQEVFWVSKSVYETRFSGTFFNKNHFAGFLEMLLPVSLSLVVAVRARSRVHHDWSARQKLLHIIQAPESQTRMILSVPVVLLAVGLAFSLSRLGVVCAGVGVSGLMILALFSERRRTSPLIGAVLAVAACFALAFASGPLLASFEGATSGRMMSMSGRIDRLRSGWAMIQDFPLAGTGLGTLMDVSGRYQSANLGNIYVMYLANDWVQIACEAGVPALFVVGAGLILFLRSTFVTAMRRSRYLRWLAAGCLMGVIAMMLHSFGDFNLIRTTSNAMLFAALLAVAHAAAHAEKKTQDQKERPGQVTLRLGPMPLRVIIGLLLVVPLLMLVGRAASVAQGDMRFNWYLHFTEQPTGLYFFLPLPEPTHDAKAAAGLELKEAIRLDPANPLYAYAAGSREMAEIDRRVAEVGEALVVETLGPGVIEQMKADPEVARQLRRIFERDAPELLAEEIKKDGLIDGAEAAFRRAVRLAPTVPEYHIALAKCLELKTRIMYNLDPASRAWEDVRAELLDELGRAVYLAPNRPYVLYDAAELYLVDGARMGGSEHTRAEEHAERLFRRAIYGAPSELAPKAYEALASAGVDNAGLAAATPRTLKACRELCRFLWTRGPLSDTATLGDILIALDQMEELLGEVRTDMLEIDLDAVAVEPGPGQQPKHEQEEEPDEQRAEVMPPSFSWGSETRSTAQLQLEIAEKRVAVLGLLGDWIGRLDALARYNALMDRSVRGKLDDARALLQRGRYELAMADYRAVLKTVPHNVDALIGMAQVMSVPYLRGMAPDAYGPLECLFRAVVTSESISSEQCAEIGRIVADQRAEAGPDKVLAEFIECAAVLIQPDAATPQTSRTAAIHRLQKLIASRDEAELSWRDRHLLWYYLGLAYEVKGDDATARRMYEGALKALPGHRRSLERIVALLSRAADNGAAGKYAALLSTLTPDQRCTTTFGGRVTLLGYSIRPDENMIHYYWEFVEPLPASYKARSHFLDLSWRDCGTDSRIIVREGGIYTSDLARSGEVIVEHRSLQNVAPDAAFIGLALASKTPPQKWPRHLVPDGVLGSVVRFPLIRPEAAAEATLTPLR